MNTAAYQLAASDQGCVPILFQLIRSLADELEAVGQLDYIQMEGVGI